MAEDSLSFIEKDCLGSTAARRRHSSSTAASGCIPALQLSIFHFANLNVCFSQQRPFKADENHENDGQLTAKSGQCSDLAGGRDLTSLDEPPPGTFRLISVGPQLHENLESRMNCLGRPAAIHWLVCACIREVSHQNPLAERKPW